MLLFRAIDTCRERRKRQRVEKEIEKEQRRAEEARGERAREGKSDATRENDNSTDFWEAVAVASLRP